MGRQCPQHRLLHLRRQLVPASVPVADTFASWPTRSTATATNSTKFWFTLAASATLRSARRRQQRPYMSAAVAATQQHLLSTEMCITGLSRGQSPLRATTTAEASTQTRHQLLRRTTTGRLTLVLHMQSRLLLCGRVATDPLQQTETW